MKKIILTTGIIALLVNTGCIVAEGHGHGHGHYRGHTEYHEEYHGHSEVIVGPPAIVVPVPVVVVRPPGIHVH